MTPVYPFSAIVGQELLRLALVLCAVRPEIGGVLIRGEKGTAKSTAVRGLASVLAEAGFGRLVELPIGATEDRVIGSLDLQRVLRDGEHAFTPGLLAEAHGGVLYVDEVNLLHDHLVDVLLDAAAMGRVHIERDGISHSHEAKFILVGTMNPEEGELRPQLLDRFGLTVDVRASRDVDERADVIRQRMSFEADPFAFARRYADQDAALAQRIATARLAVGDVVLPDRELRRIASLCAAFGVDGMRADLVVARAAVAHAAWRGADVVDEEDIRVAAQLALPHRRRRDPFDEPELDPQSSTTRWRRPATTSPEPEPDPPAVVCRMRRATMRFECSRHRRLGPARHRPRRFAPDCSRCRVSATVRRAAVRGPATGPVLWCPRMPPTGSGFICSARYWPRRGAHLRQVRLGWSPTTCVGRSAKGVRRIW